MLVTKSLVEELKKLILNKDEGYLDVLKQKLCDTRYDPNGLKSELLGFLLDLKKEDPLYIFIEVYKNDFLQKAMEIDNLSVFFG